jgi:hypothetical protein
LGGHDERWDGSEKMKFATGVMQIAHQHCLERAEHLRSVDAVGSTPRLCIMLDATTGTDFAPRIWCTIRVQHKLPAERDNPTAHAGTG